MPKVKIIQKSMRYFQTLKAIDLTNKNLWRVRKRLVHIVKMKMMLVFCQKRKLDRR